MALTSVTRAPDFTLKVTPDRSLSLGDFEGRRVVIAFYPADWSPVCGDQMTLYNEVRPLFLQHVLGISVDGITFLAVALNCVDAARSSSPFRVQREPWLSPSSSCRALTLRATADTGFARGARVWSKDQTRFPEWRPEWRERRAVILIALPPRAALISPRWCWHRVAAEGLQLGKAP